MCMRELIRLSVRFHLSANTGLFLLLQSIPPSVKVVVIIDDALAVVTYSSNAITG
jgi:hypothetical protein